MSSRSERGDRAPTLEDVAERVDMSVATVGRALGGYGRVSERTKKKVLEAARELNYHPNAVARGMKEQRTEMIGLIVGNIMNPFFSTIVRAVEDTVAIHGFNVIVCNTDEDPARELAHARGLYERRVDGLIVSPTVYDDPRATDAVRLYYGGQIPTVLIDRTLEGLDVPSVYSDNVEGGYLATRHLLELGHRRIGLVVGKRSLTTMAARIEGCERALREAGIELDASLVVDSAEVAGDVGVKGGNWAMRELLAAPVRPTAVLALNNLLVLGVLRALKDADVAVPGDVSLIAWDDFELADHLVPPLTVVDQPTYSMGSLAAERLLKAIAGSGKLERLEVVLKPRLIERSSTAAPAAIVEGAAS